MEKHTCEQSRCHRLLKTEVHLMRDRHRARPQQSVNQTVCEPSSTWTDSGPCLSIWQVRHSWSICAGFQSEACFLPFATMEQPLRCQCNRRSCGILSALSFVFMIVFVGMQLRSAAGKQPHCRPLPRRGRLLFAVRPIHATAHTQQMLLLLLLLLLPEENRSQAAPDRKVETCWGGM